MNDAVRPAWIALADGGPAAALAATLSSGRYRVVGDAAVFESLLCAGRPRVAVLDDAVARDADVTTATRERRRRSSLRLVHLSAIDAVDARLAALRCGFDEALPDTITAFELGVRLELLEHGARARSGGTMLVTDQVILDPIAHEMRRDGELVHLRPKEYRLLAMLAAHPGRAYTRRQLLDRVWGPDHDGDPRTVDVHVRWIRSKIEPTPETPVHLVTVRGVGYRLDPTPR